MMKQLVFVLCLCAWGSQAFAEIKTECGEKSGTPVFKYCLTVDTESASTDVVYFFHGLGGNERTWLNYEAFYTYWKQKGIAAPKVLTFSFGDFWLLVDRNSSPNSGLLPRVADELIPQLERELQLPVGRRMIVGVSMGGFNGLQLFLNHQYLASKAVLICPAIAEVNPFSNKEVSDFIQRTGANPLLVWSVIPRIKQYLPDVQSWSRAAPLNVAREQFSPRTPPIYVSANKLDDFGFFPDSKAFYDIAVGNGAQATWVELPGGHCSYDKESVTQFLFY